MLHLDDCMINSMACIGTSLSNAHWCYSVCVSCPGNEVACLIWPLCSLERNQAKKAKRKELWNFVPVFKI